MYWFEFPTGGIVLYLLLIIAKSLLVMLFGSTLLKVELTYDKMSLRWIRAVPSL